MTKNKTRNNTNKNFHSSGLRQKVDQMMDILYAGGVNNPMDSIEQISYLLFLRLLTERDEQLAALSKKYKRIFSGKWARYAWGNFVTLTGDQLFDSTRSAIENLHELPDLSDTGRLLFRRATLKIYDRPTLRAVIQSIHEMDLAEHDGVDIKGDMYEYLLGKISMSGTNGQFRTPRHIIDLIVDVVDPKPGQRICDPACGTSGFLISAFKHILKQNTSKADLKTGNVTGDKLKPAQWKFLEQQAFTGFDNDANMIKIAILNLYLHKLEKANIVLHNPLTTTKGGTYPGPQYDCILANPPFSGKVQKESILSDLNHGINTRATELLFLKWFIDHLADKGRAGVIVPEGIIVKPSNAYKQLRKMLVDNYLWCVVSLPAGVFNPYSGVKTSILLMDKQLAKKTEYMLFVRIENDGFDLGAQRRPIDKNDLPKALDYIKKYQKELLGGHISEDTDFAHSVEKQKIAETSDNNLSGERYKTFEHQQSNWPMVSIGDICDLMTGGTPKSTVKEYYENGNIKWLVSGDIHLAEIYDCPNRITQDGMDNSNTRVLPINSVLIALNGQGKTRGTVAMLRTEATCNQSIVSINSKDGNQLIPEFLYAVLKGRYQEIRNITGDNQRSGLCMRIIKSIKIPLPPLDIQKKLVAEIDGSQKIIDGARQVVDNYKPTIKIDPAWEQVVIEDLYDIQYGLAESIPQNLDENGIKIVSTAEVNLDGSLDLSKIRKIKYLKKYDKFLLKSDTLLFNWRNAPKHVGKTAIFAIDDDKYIYASFLLAMTKKGDNIDNKFAWLMLNKLRKDSYFRLQSRQAVNQTNFNASLLKKTKIFLPPVSIQQEIIAQIELEQEIVNANKKLIEIYEQKIKAKIADVWGCGTSQAAVEDKVDETADSGLLIAEVAERYRTDASVACLVLQHFKERGKPIREFHLQKYAYIAQQYLKLPIVSEFQPMAAGPWSSAFKDYSCAYARQQQWFSLKGRNVEPGKALKAGTAEADKSLGRQRGKVLQLLDDLKRFGDSGLERWATILMVVSQLKSAGKTVTRWNIQEAIDNWSGKRNKEWFTKISVSKAIDGMNQKGWIKIIGE